MDLDAAQRDPVISAPGTGVDATSTGVLIDAEIYQKALNRYERYFKRTLDVIASSVLIVLFAPVMLLCALAVGLSLGRPIILRQPRVGLAGRVFEVYKFRTMEPDRRKLQIAFDGEERRVNHKSPSDPRLTPTGAFLRKWSLDELPQLVNVLRGEMSLVGPRPEMVAIVARYEQWQHRRHSARPGLTGLWQISERGDRAMHEATDVDLEYLDKVSLWSDLRILALTPTVAFVKRTGH